MTDQTATASHRFPRAPRALLAAALLSVFALSPLAAAPALAEDGARADAAQPADPRAGDPAYERSQRLFGVIREILDEVAEIRLLEQTDPESGMGRFFRRQVGVDRETRVKDLLSSAFELITDAPVVQMQTRIAEARKEIAALRGEIAELRERRISAPEDGGWETALGLADDKESLTRQIERLERRIETLEAEIEAIKESFAAAMAAIGVALPREQVDLLLESVTGADMVELAAAFQAVRGISLHLRQLMDESGEDLDYARRYYGMHTALIALLLEAQNQFIEKVDTEYLPKLDAIEDDILAAREETERLLEDDPTREQRRVLEANKDAQAVALEALELYRSYLLRQRAQVAEARDRTERELRVADNTLRTVDASFQLRVVMESASASFDALQGLESPGFDRLFRNEELRREFQLLTERLSPGS